jgi:hypothetical protein
MKAGFDHCNADPNLYIKRIGQSLVIILARYADEGILLSNNMRLLEILATKFEMRDRGEIHYCLGIQVV